MSEEKKINVYTIPVNVAVEVKIAAKDLDAALNKFNNDPKSYIKRGEMMYHDISEGHYWEHPVNSSIHNLYESVFNRRLIK